MSTRDSILTLGEALFRTRGFNAFSYYDLAEALKVRPAAIHYHFPTKEDLAVAIIERERAAFRAFVDRVDAQKDVRGRLLAFARTFAPRAETREICLVGAAGGDYNSFGERVQTEVQAMANDILVWLEAVLAEGRRNGALSFAGTPRTRAMMIVATLAASLHLSRIVDASAYKRIATQLIHDLTTSSES